MNKFIRSFAMGAMLVFGATAAMAGASAADPAIGTWKLNVEKSKFSKGHEMKSETRVYAAADGGTSLNVTGVAADGSAVNQSATLTYDGKDAAMTGASFDTLSLKKINGTTTKADLKKGGKVVGHTTRTISDHGKVMTLSTAMKTDKGGTVHEVAVFDKQ